MDYDYNFTKEEKQFLYPKLKEIINSDSYKLLRKEYNNLITSIAKNIISNKIEDPICAFFLLKRNLDAIFDNVKYSEQLDLDILYKLWGSRVLTGGYSSRHIVSFINDILIRCGFISCKIIVSKREGKFPLISKYKKGKKENNYILLCLIIDNKKIFIDVAENKILEYCKLYSSFDYSCYRTVLNDNKCNYYIYNNDISFHLEVNDDHLFTLNSFVNACEFTKKDYDNKRLVIDYLSYLENLDIDLLEVENNNFDLISKLNVEISNNQNEIYKRVKRIEKDYK